MDEQQQQEQQQHEPEPGRQEHGAGSSSASQMPKMSKGKVLELLRQIDTKEAGAALARAKEAPAGDERFLEELGPNALVGYWAAQPPTGAAAGPSTAALVGALAASAGTAAGASSPILTQETIEEIAFKAAQKALEQHHGPKSKGFSSVGSTEAEGLLVQLDLREVEGDPELSTVPAGTPSCAPFDFSLYPNENSGTPDCLRHHEAHLAKLNVPFGSKAFKIYDMHSTSKVYSITTSEGQTYTGGIDGCVAPHGLFLSSARCEARVLYEHKRNEDQAAAYLAREGKPPRKIEHPGPLPYSRGEKGQAVTALLAAYAYNNFPLMVDLTDGEVHHILQVRGTLLCSWTKLTPQQAYYMQSQLLLSSPVLKEQHLRLESISEEQQGPIKKLRSLRPGSALQQQLDSVVPFLDPADRIQATLELMEPWRMAASFELPEAVQQMYA